MFWQLSKLGDRRDLKVVTEVLRFFPTLRGAVWLSKLGQYLRDGGTPSGCFTL